MARKDGQATATEEPQPVPLPPHDEPAEESHARPIFRTRMGRIVGAVWKNDGPSGSWYACKVYRIYKPEGSDTWHQSFSMGPQDCLIAAEILRQCGTWIFASQSSDTPF